MVVTKKCKYCKNDFKALESKLKVGKAKFCSKDCYNEYRKSNSKVKTENDRKRLNCMYQKKSKYGLDEKQYLNLFKVQNNKCQICKIPFTEVRACVDHNHETNKVRGLLCDNCNTALGLFKDTIHNLENAIKYLKNNGDVTQPG